MRIHTYIYCSLLILIVSSGYKVILFARTVYSQHIIIMFLIVDKSLGLGFVVFLLAEMILCEPGSFCNYECSWPSCEE
jgi:hypothetical protein